ncbi:MAG: PH domain-containing protein [Nanoarchaeota archaeon]
MDADINAVLEPSEKIVWRGIINRKVLNFGLIFSLLIILSIGTYLIAATSFPKMYGAAVIALGIILSLFQFFSNRIKEYAVTQKRILIKSGLIGTDFKSIYFNEIKNLLVDVGIIGKMFSVGTVKIDVGKTQTYSTGGMRTQGGGYTPSQIQTRTMYDELKYIDDPYKIYKYLQSTLSGRLESLYSGRADKESLQNKK